MERSGKDRNSDRIEKEEDEFHQRVRTGFLDLASEIGHQAVVLDASGSKDEVYDAVYELAGELLLNGVHNATR
jgi:dTMP kinase